MKHKLKIKYYLRYVDDFVMLSKDKNQLIKWRGEIDRFLWNKLKLKLHPKKQILQTAGKGIDFVGFVVKPDYILMRRRVVKSFKDRLWRFNQNKEAILKEEMPNMLSVVNSYYGQFKHGKTFGLRSKLWIKIFASCKISWSRSIQVLIILILKSVFGSVKKFINKIFMIFLWGRSL